MKHFITLTDWTGQEIEQLLDLAVKMKKERKAGTAHKLLEGKTLGMIFEKSSTRTRVSFEVGMYQLGGYALFLNSNDIQLGRGEDVSDTARVLSRYLDCVMIRTYSQNDVEMLAECGSIPVINGLTDLMHPCQVMADFLTIIEHKGTLKGLKMAYVGDGNNMAHSLLHGCAKVGMDISVASPEQYQCDAKMVAQASAAAELTGAKVVLTTDCEEAVQNADIVYADTWVSMGQESEKEQKLKIFAPYQINKTLFAHAKADAMFLHCLPAYRGFEVTEDVIDGKNSFVFDQAENRLHAQKAIMVELMK